jgi:flavin reductase (DIM6/NTAB) family NADH-FMN oxidoreductase RutF
MEQGGIHDDHPFATPMELRDPVRRFRGRLASPVTVVTSGKGDRRTGLTVSSLLVAEGEPSYVHFLCGTATDLWDAIRDTGTFVVHILEGGHRPLSDRFAGIRPSPGGLFAGIDVADSEYGPQLRALRSRAYCRYIGHREGALHALVHGLIERVDLHDLREPLQYFRGEYLRG